MEQKNIVAADPADFDISFLYDLHISEVLRTRRLVDHRLRVSSKNDQFKPVEYYCFMTAKSFLCAAVPVVGYTQ